MPYNLNEEVVGLNKIEITINASKVRVWKDINWIALKSGGISHSTIIPILYDRLYMKSCLIIDRPIIKHHY